AFHWFATEDSLKEIHRVLKPGAAFGMIWNIEDYNAPKEWPSKSKWEQNLKDIIASLEDGHPRFRHQKWKQAFEKHQETTPLQALKDTFTHNMPVFSLPLGEEDVEWTIYLKDEAVWDRYSTLSQIANLQGSDRFMKVRKEVLDELKGEGVERNAAGEVAVHGRTHLVWTSRV
ncbi:putative methyltransferase-like, partial [Lachnellula suecica]